jgi:uncharacterized protein (DUF488 family)
MGRQQLFTIGYEETQLRDFLDKLASAGVKTLVDVRELPQSRIPGYSKTALTAALKSKGIEYVHVPELGSPRNLRRELRETGNFTAFTRGYLLHLKKQTEQVREVQQRVYGETCCLLCFEKNHQECHRQFVAQEIKIVGRNGLEIVHL